MNLFEMAKIPLNKAIEVMKLDPSAATLSQLLNVLWRFPFLFVWTMELQKYLPVIAVSTAPLWGRLKAAFVIIPESTWTK